MHSSADSGLSGAFQSATATLLAERYVLQFAASDCSEFIGIVSSG